MLAQRPVALVEKCFDRYVEFLCRLCSFETKAYYKDEIDRMVDYIAEFARGEGFTVTRIPFENCGDFLTIEINENAEKGGVLLAHMDTVHEKGAFGDTPVTVHADRIVGPGTIDCKGGIAVAMLAMKALLDSGYDRHLRLLLTSDEEISNKLGGAKERAFFSEKVVGFPCALNCEVAENNEVVISRKGIIKYRVDIRGVSGHSGIHYFSCSNPVLEAAKKIVDLQNKSEEGGITYSCNIVNGGVLENIIPETCSFSVDIRVPTQEHMRIAQEEIRKTVEKSFVSGTSATLTKLSERPPMEKNDRTQELFNRLQSVSQAYGLGELTAVESGGGSDSCYTQQAGVTSICGLGPCGEFCHTNREYVLTETIARRAKLLAAFFVEEGKQ